MRIRRLIAIVLIATVLGTGAPNPPATQADNTAWIVIGSIAAYFGFVLLATWLVTRGDSSFSDSSVSPFLPGQPLEFRFRDPEKGVVRVGPDCAALKQGLSVICW